MAARRGELLHETLIEIISAPYTSPKRKEKELNVIREFFKTCLTDAGMETIRAEIIAGELMDIFGSHAEALHIDHNLQGLFEFDILAPILIREKEFGINLTKYYTFKS